MKVRGFWPEIITQNPECLRVLVRHSQAQNVFRSILNPSIKCDQACKIGHLGSQNLTTFQTLVTHNFLLKLVMATKFSELVYSSSGFITLLTELKYCISVLK